MMTQAGAARDATPGAAISRHGLLEIGHGHVTAQLVPEY